MESTGARNRIHLSSETAEIVRAAGKEHWIERRKGQIQVKGKGPQCTYWVRASSDSSGSAGSESVCGRALDPVSSAGLDVTEIAHSHGMKNTLLESTMISTTPKITRLVEWNVGVLTQRLIAIQLKRTQSERIDPKVLKQLKIHVEGIAVMYREHPFHNFEVSDADKFT
jgi:Adenylate and Guanylate cyclase catalytic domain